MLSLLGFYICKGENYMKTALLVIGILGFAFLIFCFGAMIGYAVGYQNGCKEVANKVLNWIEEKTKGE